MQERERLIATASRRFGDEQRVSGGTFNAHMHRLERFKAIQAGKNPDKVKAPQAEPVTGPLAYLFVHYQDLRGANARGFSVEPIAFSEILAYATLFEISFDAFDVDTLRRLDVVWLQSLPKPQQK